MPQLNESRCNCRQTANRNWLLNIDRVKMNVKERGYDVADWSHILCSNGASGRSGGPQR
jgi:hypothetical protein